jgi:hypothetical protein
VFRLAALVSAVSGRLWNGIDSGSASESASVHGHDGYAPWATLATHRTWPCPCYGVLCILYRAFTPEPCYLLPMCSLRAAVVLVAIV